MPQLDEYQDIHDTTGSYDNGQMTFTFTRKRNTGHLQDVPFTDEDCTYFTFMYGGTVDDTGTMFENKHFINMKMSQTKFCFRRCPKFGKNPLVTH